MAVAEALKEDPQLKNRPIWVIKEIEDPDILNLLRYCQDLQEALEVPDWYGNTGDKAMMANFYHLSRKQGKARFSFKAAHYANEPNGLAFYMSNIKKISGNQPQDSAFRRGEQVARLSGASGAGQHAYEPGGIAPHCSVRVCAGYLDRISRNLLGESESP